MSTTTFAGGCSQSSPNGDGDLLVIIEQPLTERQRRALPVELIERRDRGPILGGLELSMVLRDRVEAVVNPVACELHFSEMWAAECAARRDWPSRLRRVEPDAAASR